MQKIKFAEHILPHLTAVAIFLIVTVIFFKPIFFEGKTLRQGDILQFTGISKEVSDYREQTGKEALWTNRTFSGMPTYLVGLRWSNQPLDFIKSVMSVGLPHPISNFFLAFLCYYIMLLAFQVRPYLAIAGALAFGLSSFMIVGLAAGHNTRVGAMAFMPLVLAGIHLAFSRKLALGFVVTATALALQIKENHLQVTYYLIFVVMAYGAMQLAVAFKEKTWPDFFKNMGVLVGAAVLAAATVVGPLWAVSEYSKYSTRGKSELSNPTQPATSGLNKDYAFFYSYGISEPLTALIPDFLGGASSNYLVSNPASETYKALMQSNNQQVVNQLAQFSSSYFGEQPLAAPYYAGAIICFLFVLGFFVVDKKIVYWLAAISILAIVMSWGKNLDSVNSLLFTYMPGYSKFRSVTFALIMLFLAIPLLGTLALEKILNEKWNQSLQKKLLGSFILTGGLCLVIALMGNFSSYLKADEQQLPAWFTAALRADRADLVQSDAWRSFWFIAVFFALLFASVKKWVQPIVFIPATIILILIDVSLVDRRYFTKDNYQRKRDVSEFAQTQVDAQILSDKSDYRVFNLSFNEGFTSYYHQSVGGYHGAPLRRYKEFYDSCVSAEVRKLAEDLQQGRPDYTNYHAINMLNIKYITYYPDQGDGNVFLNTAPNGNAWFVQNVLPVKNANEELSMTCTVNTKETAVVDQSKFTVKNIIYDSASSIQLIQRQPDQLTYEAETSSRNLAVLSEIYYPEGWRAFIDGKETAILRVNYTLRALIVPEGKHTIELRFEPDAYHTGNKITAASSWLLILVLLGGLGWTVRREVRS